MRRPVGFGVDLGTGYARAAMLVGRTPELVRVLDGAGSIPMVVALDQGNVKIGAAAVAEAATKPETVARSFLPLLGKTFDHPSLRFVARHTGAPLVRRPDGGISLTIADQPRDPEELVTLFIKQLLGLVERQFSRVPETAVFSVPQWFDTAARDALGRAAEKAGIGVEKMICDGQAMGFMQAGEADRAMAIVDVGALGVGVMVVSASTRKVVLRAGHWQPQGGGDDVDRALMDMCLADLGKPGLAIIDNPGIMDLFRQAIEGMKRDLCDAGMDVATHAFQHAPAPLELKRDRLDKVLRGTAKTIVDECKRALATADASVADMECVFLNGGMTRLPLVRAWTTEIFQPWATPLPLKEGAAALGAAMYSSALKEKAPIMRDLRPPEAPPASTSVAPPRTVPAPPIPPVVPAPPFSSPLSSPLSSPPPSTPASSPPSSQSEAPQRARSSSLTPAAIQAAIKAPRLSGMMSRTPPPMPGVSRTPVPGGPGAVGPWTVTPSGIHATPPEAKQAASAPPPAAPAPTSVPAPAAHADPIPAPRTEPQFHAPVPGPVTQALPAATAPGDHAGVRVIQPPSAPDHAAVDIPRYGSSVPVRPPSAPAQRAATSSHPGWTQSARPSAEPLRRNLLEEMLQGKFVKPESAAAILHLACARPLVTADLAPMTLPVLLVRLIAAARATGTLTLEGPHDTTLNARIEDGRAVLSVREHNTLVEAFTWPEGFYRFEHGSAGKLTGKGPKPVPLMQITVEGLRPLIRTYEPDDIESAIANRLHLAPIIALGREGVVSRMGLTGLEARMAENNLDGFTSGMALIDHGRLGRQTTLGLLVILTVFDAIDWIVVKEVPKATPEEELTTRAIKLDGQNHFLALGVHWSTLTEDIDAAYKALSAMYAPRPGASPEVDALLVRIRTRLAKAYEVLKDPHRRRSYRRETYQLDYHAVTDLAEQRADSLAMRADRGDMLESRHIAEELGGGVKRESGGSGKPGA